MPDLNQIVAREFARAYNCEPEQIEVTPVDEKWMVSCSDGTTWKMRIGSDDDGFTFYRTDGYPYPVTFDLPEDWPA